MAFESATTALKCGFEVNISDQPIPTPILKYNAITSNSLMGLMITGGDLDKNWNGYKLYYPSLIPLNDETIINSNSQNVQDKINIIPQNYINEYNAYLKKIINLELIGKYGKSHQPTESILIDSMGGCGKTFMEDILIEHGWRVQTIFGSPLDTFYERIPTINDEQIKPLSYNVSVTDAILGIMLNGDCSECGIVNYDGKFISKNKISDLIKNYYKTIEGEQLKLIMEDGILSSLIILEIICVYGKNILD